MIGYLVYTLGLVYNRSVISNICVFLVSDHCTSRVGTASRRRHVPRSRYVRHSRIFDIGRFSVFDFCNFSHDFLWKQKYSLHDFRQKNENKKI